MRHHAKCYPVTPWRLSALNALKREKLCCRVVVLGGGRDALFSVAVVLVSGKINRRPAFD